MVLPLLTSLDVRLSPRNLYSQDQELQQMAGDDGRIPVPYNVSIRNMGDGARAHHRQKMDRPFPPGRHAGH